LDERLDEYELERRVEERSLSFTFEWVCLSGEAGGVPELAWGEGRGARLGISLVLDDFFEDAKKEGRTMGASCGRIAAWTVSLEFLRYPLQPCEDNTFASKVDREEI